MPLLIQVHYPTDSVGDFIGSVLTLIFMLAVYSSPFYYFHKKLKLKGRWYSPLNWVRQLTKPYEGEFDPVTFSGDRAIMQYKITNFERVWDAWMFHKSAEKDINKHLRILLAKGSRADVYEHAASLHIEILYYGPPEDYVWPDTPAQPTPVQKPKKEKGIVIGE